MSMSRLSPEVLLETIHDLRDLGYYYFVREDERSVPERVVELGRGLQLVLKIAAKDICYFYIQKNFRDGSKIVYSPETTELRGKAFIGFALAVNEGKLEMDIPIYELDAVPQQAFLRNVTKLPYALAHSLHDRYSAEYDHSNNLAINLWDCTTDEFLLRYFSKNSFVTTSLFPENEIKAPLIPVLRKDLIALSPFSFVPL